MKSREQFSEKSFNETSALAWGIYCSFQTAVIGTLGVWLAAATLNILAKKFG